MSNETPMLPVGIEDLIAPLRRHAYALVRRADHADDLVQDCLTRALSRAHLFTPGRELRPWLFAILRHEYLNWHRRNRRQPLLVPLEDVASHAFSPLGQDHAMGMRDAVRAVVGLTETERQILLLVVAKGLSYDQAAKTLGVPVGTIRSRLFRARARLRGSRLDEALPASTSVPDSD